MYEHCYQINAVRAVSNENFNNTLKSGLTRFLQFRVHFLCNFWHAALIDHNGLIGYITEQR